MSECHVVLWLCVVIVAAGDLLYHWRKPKS